MIWPVLANKTLHTIKGGVKRLPNERPGNLSCYLCWPIKGLKMNCIMMGQHTKKTQTSRLLDWITLDANSVKNRACICGCLLFTESAPLGWFSHRVAMYGCLSVYAIRWSFFSRPFIGPEVTWSLQGLSLVPPAPPPNPPSIFFFFYSPSNFFWWFQNCEGVQTIFWGVGSTYFI